MIFIPYPVNTGEGTVLNPGVIELVEFRLFVVAFLLILVICMMVWDFYRN
jgi:hypothetical protein